MGGLLLVVWGSRPVKAFILGLCFYPVPQNALYVSAGMNVLKFPKGKP